MTTSPWRFIIKDNRQKTEEYINDPSVDINTHITMENRLSMLHVAISEQKPVIYNAILKHKELEIDTIDCFGKTALHYACANGDKAAIIALIAAGADVNKTNNAGETPFMKACYFLEKDVLTWMLTDIEELNVSCKDCTDRNGLDILKSNLHLKEDLIADTPELQRILDLIVEKMNIAA